MPSKLEFPEIFSGNSFALSNEDNNTSGPLYREGRADLSFAENTINYSPEFSKPDYWEITKCFVLFA